MALRNDPLTLPYVNEHKKAEFHEVCNRIVKKLEAGISQQAYLKPIELVELLHKEIRVPKKLILDAIVYLLKKNEIQFLKNFSDWKRKWTLLQRR